MTIWVPLLAGGLLAIAELAFSRGRVAWSAIVGLGGVVVGAIVLAAAEPNVGRSVPLTLAGTAAAVGALAIVRALARR